MKRILVAALFAACTLTAFALPSSDAVRAEVDQGHDARAEQMIREVIAARPDSARARYVHAEILARQGRFAQAAEEAAQARRLDPSLSFTQPETFKAFEALLAREQAAAGARPPAAVPHAAPAGHSGGVPAWVWGGGLALLAAVVVGRLAAARQTATPAPPGLAPTASAPGLGTGPAPIGPVPFGPAPIGPVPAAPAGAAGSGLLGTALALAGGVATGMLAERLLAGQREPAPAAWWSAPPAPAAFEPLGDPAAEAARALEERPIDMGSGDGWGGTDADPTGSGSSDGW